MIRTSEQLHRILAAVPEPVGGALMGLGITGRTAVVCASTSGLGEAVARALAAEGAHVVISGRRGERARQIAGELPSAVGVEADVTDPTGDERLLAATRKAFGEVDILIVNGPGPKPGPAAHVSEPDVDAAIDTLLRPQVQLVSAVLPGMRERRWGRILAVGSTGISAPLPNLALSNLGRAALAGYLKTIAAEVAADGVTVNLLLPGRIATDRAAVLDEGRAERKRPLIGDVRRESRAEIPAGRYGDPAEFGSVGAFLCSEQASYVTGTAVRCDGGLVRSL
jgi:3-oxoacyl-[acyl-carrier protein] reductase